MDGTGSPFDRAYSRAVSAERPVEEPAKTEAGTTYVVDLVTALDLTAPENLEPVVAWGNDMVLDTRRATPGQASLVPTTLAELRRALIAQLPQTGPIFA